MAGAILKKRSRDDAPKSKQFRPTKKQRKIHAYHSDSEDDDAEAPIADATSDFQAVNLLDSDSDDIHNAVADDGAASGSDDSASEASAAGGSDSEAKPAPRKKAAAAAAPKKKLAQDAPASENDDDDDDSEEGESDGYSSSDGSDAGRPRGKGKKSKRSDPDAFATSLTKILSTKLSTSRRADPVLARSAAAQQASRQAVDTALETKARKKLREQKRMAMEKGRVKDVLVATNSVFTVNPVTGDVEDVVGEETTGQILETEKRLRKVAQKGVVQLFNAFRTAQVKAAEAEKAARQEGVIGIDRKKEKVTEMSKKGFLDLIASGGGGMKKGGLEEA